MFNYIFFLLLAALRYRSPKYLSVGIPFSLPSFNIYSEDIMREALEGFNGGVKFGGTKITNLRYADDTTLVCSSREELIDLLNRIKKASEEKDLLLNTKKTNIMVVDKDSNNNDFTTDGKTIEILLFWGVLA